MIISSIILFNGTANLYFEEKSYEQYMTAIELSIFKTREMIVLSAQDITDQLKAYFVYFFDLIELKFSGTQDSAGVVARTPEFGSAG